MKSIYIIVLSSFLISCGIEYDAETRLILESGITDTQGNPISGQSVQVICSSSESTSEISNGVTDISGLLKLIFPAPKQDSTQIKVVFADDDGEFISRSVDYIYKSNFENYKLSLNPMVLARPDELASLNLILNNLSGNNKDITSIEIVGNLYDLDEHYNVPPPGDIVPTEFLVFNNQLVTLNYTVTDYNISPPASTDYSIPITIESSDVTYTIDY